MHRGHDVSSKVLKGIFAIGIQGKDGYPRT